MPLTCVFVGSASAEERTTLEEEVTEILRVRRVVQKLEKNSLVLAEHVTL